MKSLLTLLIALSFLGCSKSNSTDPTPNSIKFEGTSWVGPYIINNTTGEILYARLRFTTDKDVIEEFYNVPTKILNSTSYTYKYEAPRIKLTRDSNTYSYEVSDNKIKSLTSSFAYIKE